MLVLHLPADIEARLNALAKRTGRSKNHYAREAIIAHLDDLEDLALAEQRLDDLAAGRSDTVTLDELTRRRGIGD